MTFFKQYLITLALIVISVWVMPAASVTDDALKGKNYIFDLQ